MRFQPGAPFKVKMSPNTSGPRPASGLRYVVIHCTESPNPGAEAVASYFASPGTASTHLVIDDDGGWRCVPDLVTCWGASSAGHGANECGLHIEQCGYASWSRARWIWHRNTYKFAAWHTAKWCVRYKIPTNWLTASELRAGLKGITSHHNVSDAWVPGGHTDPGPGWPQDKFMFWVHEYAGQMKRKR